MKKLILFTLLFLFYQTGNTQIVASSCYAPDSIVELYQLDADYLTVTKFYDLSYPEDDENNFGWPFPAFAPDSNSIYVPSFSSDSIDVIIPKHLSDSILKALIAVYNATEIPERDSVVDLFDIHIEPKFDLSQFYVSELSGPSLENGLPSGDVIVDSLANLYNLSPEYISSIDFSTLNSPNNLNPFALKDASWDPSQDSLQESFQWGPKIYTSWYSSPGAPHNNIEFEFHEEYTTLTYIYSWNFGEPREWEFKIYPDCSVEFVGVTGNTIPQEDNTVSIDHKTEFKTKLYPNPTTGLLNIEAQDFAAKVVVTDVLGKVHYQAPIMPASTTTLHLQELSLGTYFLQLVDEQGSILFNNKFLKVK